MGSIPALGFTVNQLILNIQVDVLPSTNQAMCNGPYWAFT